MRSAEGNLDLNRALWRVEEARALRGVVGRSTNRRWVSAPTPTGRCRATTESSAILLPRRASRRPISSTSVLVPRGRSIVFGRIRRQVEAADAEIEASVEAYRDVLVSLYAETALAYVNVRASQERLRIAHANVEAQENTLQLTKDRFDSGLVSALDVAQAESNLANTYSLIPVIENGTSTRGSTASRCLLGDEPGRPARELDDEIPIPQEPEEVTTGLPTELLRQRPDVRPAERLLASQTAQIGVATADLYPTFSLADSSVWRRPRAGDLCSDSVTWNIGLPIRWNIFAGGGIRSRIGPRRREPTSSSPTTNRAVLHALEEFENAMVAYVKEVARRERLIERGRRHPTLTRSRPDPVHRGSDRFPERPRHPATLLLREDELAVSEGLVIGNLVELYRALGGGWDPDTAQPPATPPSSFDKDADVTESEEEGAR